MLAFKKTTVMLAALAGLPFGCRVQRTDQGNDSGDSIVSQVLGAGPSTTANAFEFGPGVLVDPDRPAVYLMNPQGGIDAVDLSSGALIWSTVAAAKPLLLHGDLLVAQAEGGGNFDIVTLDTKNAGRLVLVATVDLPEGVSASVDDGLGTSFLVSARRDESGVFVLWRFATQQISGADPGEDAAVRQVSGAARIDLETGRVDPLDPQAVPEPAEPPLPENVARLIETGELTGPVWRAGSVLATIVRARDRTGERVTLRRWEADSGAPLPSVLLFGPELTLRYPSVDSRHLLASKLIDAATSTWGWSIYSLETGERVAEVPVPLAGTPFFIWKSRLIHRSPPLSKHVEGQWISEPLKVRSIEAASGVEIWARSIRDTAYRGPLPPTVPASDSGT